MTFHGRAPPPLRSGSAGAGALVPALVAVLAGVAAARRSALGDSTEDLFLATDASVREKVGKLCDVDVALRGCRAMGATGGFGTTAELADALAVEPEDAAGLLSELGLGASFGCQELCEAAVTSIPAILNVGIPNAKGAGCVDRECRADPVDVSEEALVQSDLVTTPESPEGNHTVQVQVPEGLPQAPVYPGEGPRMMLRVALNVLFGVFPAPDEADDEVPEGYAPGSLLQSDGSLDPKFGSLIRADRHEKYRRMVVTGSNWVSTALRKMGERKSIVKKWFVMKDPSKDELDKQVKEARLVMTKILTALSNLYLKKGVGHCRRNGDGGTLAFVEQMGMCDATKATECGTKEGNRFVVNICPDWFWEFPEDHQTATIVHECSHHFGTVDNAYGEKKCLKLSYDKARQNADTYQLLVRALAKSSGVVEFDGPSEDRAQELREKLNSLVGLEQLKKSMSSMLDQVAFSKEREKLGLKSFAGQSAHMRFLGNPGTGKTVVARIVGELMMAMGAISPPEDKEDATFVFREASRADLVAGYKGQTAPKVQAVVKEALGGVLFIDEAYALVQGPKDSFGREAVDTLIKEMEDNRKHLIVILAGYNKEMEDFFNSNPGFRSRVPFTFNFHDYTCPELVKIGQLQLKGKGLELANGGSCEHDSACWWTSRSVQMATQCCDKEDLDDCNEGGVVKENRANGNGRTVRNILEASYRQMALRVLKKYTPQQLQDFAKKVVNFPEMNCNHPSDIFLPADQGDYHGPDIRCDFTLLDGADLANATVEMVNMNMAPCKKTIQLHKVEALAHGGNWLEVATKIAEVTEKRIQGGEALEKACDAVMEMVSATVHPVLLELEQPVDVKADSLVAVSQHVAARVASSFNATSAVLGTKVPEGFTPLENPGSCKNQRFKTMKSQGEQRLSLMQCAAECLDDDLCTGFDHIDAFAKCNIYYMGIPAYAGGRRSVHCYRKTDLPPGAGTTFKPPPPGPKLPKPVSHTPRRRRTFSPGGIGIPNKPDQSDIDDNRVDGKTPAVDEIMDELNGLVGLMKVKAGMTELHAMVEFDHNRKAILPEAKSLMGQSFHMQFLGNPGTGKTVVARIVGRLLVEMGVIIGLEDSKGEKQVVFEEVSRADLVAEYKGQTAPKVIAAVERAMGGVLFIDEAYSLKKAGKDSFGQEAVDTLIKEIEDKRDEVIAIFAGYENEMEVFFDSNPGFKSRVPFKFYFDDYACQDLSSIADLFMKKKGFTADTSAGLWLNRTVRLTTGCCEAEDAEQCAEASRDNGNGRTVRNILESTYRNFATRVVPTIHSGELRALVERVEEFTQLKKSKRSEYETKFSPSSATRHLEKDFGYDAMCGQEWASKCDEAKGRLTQLQGEDVMMTTASMISDLMLASCREEKIMISEVELLLKRAVQVVSEEQWKAIVAATADTDCTYLKEQLKKMSGLPDAPVHDTLSIMQDSKALAPVLAQLQRLVGLDNVKETMGKLFGLVKLSTWREGLQLSSLQGQSFHMRFLGNPGTGKTVVARIVGEMLVKMEVVEIPEGIRKNMTHQIKKDAKDAGEKIPKDHEIELPLIFKEASRADLVAQYTGQTAPKVEAIVTSALGGVLFIDEAYAIVRDAKDNFGQEAVDTLIKEMEDKRDEIVVILAGYETEMDTFFDSNPGFKSRVPLTFRFEDYSCAELSAIQNLVLGGSGIEVPDGMNSKLDAMVSFSTGCCDDIAAPDCHPSRENGNGRTVRNVVEALSRAMASRVMQAHQGKGTTPSMEELQYLASEDVTMVAEEAAEIKLGIPCGPNGLVQQLYQSMSEGTGGLRSWYLENRRLADPIDSLFKLLNDYDTMSKAMTEFGSDKLTRLSEQCQSGIDGMIERLKSAGEEMCGVDGSDGTLDHAAAQLDEAQSNSGFHTAMSKVEAIAMEIILFKRMTKLNGDQDELPSALETLIPVAAHCVDKLEGMRSKKVLVELSAAMNVLADKVS